MKEKNKDKTFQQRREELLKSRLVTENCNQSSQYLESLIEDVVLNGVSFDNQLPFLLSFAAREGLDAEQVKNDFVVLLGMLHPISKQPSKSEKMAILYQAQICHISEKVIQHILSDLQEKKKKEQETAKKKAEAEKKAREKAEAEKIAREKAEAEKKAREKDEAEKNAHEKAEAEKRAREKAEAEKKTKADSLYQKGKSFFNKNNCKEAIPYLLESAMLGDSRAQATLSNCYSNGKGVDRNSTEAFRWAMASAQQDNPWGQVFVGIFFLYGSESLKPNNEQAFLWFKKSADQNNPKGLFYLGQCYYCGVGVAPDTEIAYDYFCKSADYGDSYAKNIIKGETWPLLTKDILEKTRQAFQQESD